MFVSPKERTSFESVTGVALVVATVPLALWWRPAVLEPCLHGAQRLLELCCGDGVRFGACVALRQGVGHAGVAVSILGLFRKSVVIREVD